MAKQVCSLARRCYLCACDGRVVCFYYFTFNVSLSQPPKTASKKKKIKKKEPPQLSQEQKEWSQQQGEDRSEQGGEGGRSAKEGKVGCWCVQPRPSSSRRGRDSGPSHFCATCTQSSPFLAKPGSSQQRSSPLPPRHHPHCHQHEETEDPTRGHGERGSEQSPPHRMQPGHPLPEVRRE